jgi:pimeloyl-ACP methyl ester carboxylesterase
MPGETAPTATRNIGGAEAGTRSYDVSVPPAYARVPGEPEGRGLASAAVRKVLEVVAFPLIEEGISLLSDRYVPLWEGKRQPYGIRSFTPDDYAVPGGRVVDGAELAKGRALLMVHGTFSRAHAAFGALDKSAVERLHRKYEGRVFGFDHFTLSHDPRQNVDWLLAQLPDSATLDVDIICHSRGGLVSRVLAERTGELSRTVHVGKVLFVGSPNAGTQLADPEYVGKFIDTYTNLLALVPTNGVTDVLEGILTAAKVIAVGMAKGLRGLQSMHPSGAFTRALNARVADGAAVGDAQYFALASDFSPRSAHPALSALLANRVMDGVFKQAKNDLVVPTDSVFAENGAPRFPITQAKVFSGGDALAHTEFFASDKVREQLLNWLGA